MSIDSRGGANGQISDLIRAQLAVKRPSGSGYPIATPRFGQSTDSVDKGLVELRFGQDVNWPLPPFGDCLGRVGDQLCNFTEVLSSRGEDEEAPACLPSISLLHTQNARCT